MNNSFYGRTVEKMRERINFDMRDRTDIREAKRSQSKLMVDFKKRAFRKIKLHSFK